MTLLRHYEVPIKEAYTEKTRSKTLWEYFQLQVMQLTFNSFEAMKLLNLNKGKSAQQVRTFWDKGIRIRFKCLKQMISYRVFQKDEHSLKAVWFQLESIFLKHSVLKKIFSILALSRKRNNTSVTTQQFMCHYELLSLPGSWFLFFSLPTPKNQTWRLTLTGHSNHSWWEGNVGELTKSNFQKKYLSTYYTVGEILHAHQCKHC